MDSSFLLLLYLGLCAGQTDVSGDGSLFKPVLHIWPSSVAPTMGNVTLMCTTFMREARCVFKRGGTDLDNRTTLVLTTWASILHNGMGLPGTGEYQLTELQLSDAGYYTCECSENEGTDVLSSDAILLLVTAHPGSNVTAGRNVTLRCEKPDNMTEYKMFMLLKEGDSSPVQILRSERNRADFSLQDITDRDTGNYSCVYHQIGAPFWASHPSDHLEILVSDFLPKPSLSAWPNSVASENSNVILRCVSPTPDTRLVLRKGDTVLDSRLPHHLTEGTAEFHLTNLQQSHAGYYTCRYHLKESPNRISFSSDVLFLLVTGHLSQPSLQVQHWGHVSAGGKVILQCQRPHNSTQYKMFALLKEGTSSPVQLLKSESDKVEFTLQDVTVQDAGRYSCVYLQAEAPFRASHPSDHLDVSVAITPRALAECYTKINLIRLGMSAMFVMLMAVFLAEAWYSQRVSPSRPRPRSTLGTL
ncbi:T-cell-interacting, activating receptor on myeloid cells protein 1 isoform X2 [Mesocricetus auratus]|uniref:T-cell-interacting, activating receptor on myeloid cells protein 1 isoform X2 n=1 Tax=Mesocricetus auratus TaxID=10036 RepID=UPI001AEF8EF1|nr:T-cell-interacting, activating receptor on myeloid cells protein 1 isoform X2 [Mesocricetus auratus]